MIWMVFNIRKVAYFYLIVSMFAFVSCVGSKKKSAITHPNPTNKPESTYKSNPKADEVVSVAKSYLGTRYKYGGTDKRGMDCSGLVCTSYKAIGITLPRTSNEQSNFGDRIYIGELQPGDLVFFGAKPNSSKITHVGMITSTDGKMIVFVHSSTSSGVREDNLNGDYWKPRYIKAVRPLGK